MWQDLWVALALVLVIEGLLPSISPRSYRRVMIQVAQMDDRSIRTTGLVTMVIGAVLVYLLRH